MAPGDSAADGADIVAGPTPDRAGEIAVEVMVGLAPRQVACIPLRLPVGSTVRQALDAAGVWGMAETLQPGAIESGAWAVGVWGRKERLGHPLRHLDRVELVRALEVDPKEARRVRYRAHGEKLPRGIQRSKPR